MAAEREEVVFGGNVYRRYPNAKARSNRIYFKPVKSRSGLGSLHVEIWKAAHGPVPCGHHIHHRDGNPLNNAIDNLECLAADVHLKKHAKPIDHVRLQSMIDRRRQVGYSWHSSPEGRAWHSKHALARLPAKERCLVCGSCGVAFVTRCQSGRVEYCSHRCQQRARKARVRAAIDLALRGGT